MKLENYRNKKKVNMLTTALLGIFFYILIVLILKTIQDWIPMGSVGMKVYGVIKLVLTSLYLIFYTWYNFRNASQENTKSFAKYLLVLMIPFIVMTLLTILVTYIGSDGTFGNIWNKVTFVISPTLFCFIPYGIIYEMMSALPLAVFMILCLGYMALMQWCGYVIGARNRKFAYEREQKRQEESQRVLRRQDEMARKAQIAAQRRNARAYIPDENDPLKDIENMAVIETEAFSPVTDEMIETAVQRHKIKTVQEKTKKRQMRAEIQNASRANQNRQSDRNAEQSNARQQPLTNAEAEQLSNQDKQQLTQNLDRELAFLRKKMAENEDKA